jgi:hypothetical protein
MSNKVRCTATALNLRTLPVVAADTSTGRVLVEGQEVTVHGRSLDEAWLFVAGASGAGWASAQFLQPVLAGMVAEPAIRQVLIPGNHGKGRPGPILAIVMHIMEGTMAGTLSHFRSPASGVSTHYGIGKDGSIVQYVRDEDTAQHAGIVDRPTSALVRERRSKNAQDNPNGWTLGIEHEGHAGDVTPPAQIAASVALVRYLADKHGVPLDRTHVIAHREIRASKTCPGKLPVDMIVAAAAAGR